jgi:beta-glucosidase/6-phospho-beta-glucosidase/beta-galactosidase
MRKIEFAISWFADPIYHGKYPDSMRKQLGDRLPSWSDEDIALVRGSNDFYGMNHYCANYIRHKEGEPHANDFQGNIEILYFNKAGDPIGPETQSFWLRPNPLGFRKLIKWLSDRYGGPTFYVTENGTSLKGENDLPLDKLLDDEFRCEYFRGYVGALADAHTIDGVDVRGYTAWSLMEYVPPSHLISCYRPVTSIAFLQHPLVPVQLYPLTFSHSCLALRRRSLRCISALTYACSNFEWAEGYETRFGVTYVDYDGDQKRYPKKSAKEIGNIFDRYIRT